MIVNESARQKKNGVIPGRGVKNARKFPGMLSQVRMYYRIVPAACMLTE